MTLHSDVALSGVAADVRPVGSAGVSSDSEGAAGAMPKNGRGAQEAAALAAKAATARLAGEEPAAERFFQAAVAVALQAIEDSPAASPEGTADEPDLPLRAAQWALACGDVATARRLQSERGPRATAGDGARSAEDAEAWAQIGTVDRWPDAWLVATVRCSAPDGAALDTLAQRHWKVLFGRCQMLTANRAAAADLAQDTWCRVLRGRERLRPGGNFRAYLLMIATNLWRDSQRAALRAGTLAHHRLVSIDREATAGEAPGATLSEILPDVEQMEAAERERLKSDLDQALARLEALWRDVLVARFLDGESCAEIGRRYGRTEQTANGWVRRALSEMKLCLAELRRDAH